MLVNFATGRLGIKANFELFPQHGTRFRVNAKISICKASMAPFLPRITTRTFIKILNHFLTRAVSLKNRFAQDSAHKCPPSRE